MSRFLLQRLLFLIPTLLGVLIVTFLLLYVAPGDPVQAMVGERADPETLARLASRVAPGRSAAGAVCALPGRRAAGRSGHQLHHPPSHPARSAAALSGNAPPGRSGHAVRGVDRHQHRHIWRLETGCRARPGGGLRRVSGYLVSGLLGRTDSDSDLCGKSPMAAAVRLRRPGLSDPAGVDTGDALGCISCRA